jgi:4-aminobutyrate aminotransferase-like enzyme
MNKDSNMDSGFDWIEYDRQHVWHPYAAVYSDIPVFPVQSAQGVRIRLQDGRELIDGMSSWWSAIHGYNHPILNQAIEQQLKSMAHVMFGGLTHEPASSLVKLLVDLTPDGLEHVFLSDSGSVSVEVAMKMAMQYWYALGQTGKQKFLAIPFMPCQFAIRLPACINCSVTACRRSILSTSLPACSDSPAVIRISNRCGKFWNGMQIILPP